MGIAINSRIMLTFQRPQHLRKQDGQVSFDTSQGEMIVALDKTYRVGWIPSWGRDIRESVDRIRAKELGILVYKQIRNLNRETIFH